MENTVSTSLEGTLAAINSLLDYGTCPPRKAKYDFEKSAGLSCLVAPRAYARAIVSLHCLQRISEPHGLGEGELRLAVEAGHYLERLRHDGVPVVYAVLGDALLDLPEREARAVAAAFRARIVREQARANLPAVWLQVWEAASGLHANVVFAANPVIVAALRRSVTLKPYLRGENALRECFDVDRLVGSYLTKERRPNVKGGSWLGTRRKGQHRLGEGGGDRVSVSEALRAELVASGKVQPWKRTYVRRLPKAQPPAPEPTPVVRLVVSNAVVPEPVQLSMFGDRPVSRLADYGGGIMSAAVAHEVEWHRRRLGMTQDRLAASIGISRPQLTNALHERFGLSRWAAARLRDFLIGADHKLAA